MPKENTVANKARRVETRQRHFNRAQNRRDSGEYVVPMNAMTPLAGLPRKAQDKWREAHPEIQDSNPLVVDPRRGLRISFPPTIRDARATQTVRVARKRTQRRNFSKLKPADKRLHREAGLAHVRPGELRASGKS